MTGGYALLSRDIHESSLWVLPAHVRVVFLTLVALKDRDGFVPGSDAMIRRKCNVSEEEWEESIDLLLSPDPDSSSTIMEGRRVVRAECDGRRGLRIVTHHQWEDRWSAEAKKEADARRQQEKRLRETSRDRVPRDMSQDDRDTSHAPRDMSQPQRDASHGDCDSSQKVAHTNTRPLPEPDHTHTRTHGGAPAPGSLSSEHPAEDSPPQSLARPVTPRPPPPDLADVALRLTAAPHEFPYVAPILAPAIATVWEAWREFARSPNAPCPRTWAGTRPIIERLADGHSPESLATALRNAHPRCWARGRGLAAALSNLDSLARDGASTAGGKPPVGQTQTEGSRWRGQQATIRSMVHSRLCVVLPGYEDMSDEERRLLWEPLSDRLQAEGWDGEGQMPPTPEIDRWVDDAHRKGAA